MKSTRLKAFTLIEIMVSLVITAVVMLMAAYGFNTVTTMSGKVGTQLSSSESSYLVMADVERLFLTETELVKRFNEVQFGETVYDFGVDYTTRNQEGRLDTFPELLTRPLFGIAAISSEGSLPSDSLSFLFRESRFTLVRNTSLADFINKAIVDGED